METSVEKGQLRMNHSYNIAFQSVQISIQTPTVVLLIVDESNG